MRVVSAVRLALGALLVHKGRSFLTSLGIVIGIGAVIAMVSAGEGARLKLDERLENAGKNLIIVRPGLRAGAVIADFTPLTQKDAEAIRRDVGPWLVGAVPWQVMWGLASTRTTNHATEIIGTLPEFQRVGNWKVVRGRLFDNEDLKKAAPVCVIGQTARRHLFPDNPNPVGEMIRVDRLAVRVIGVLGAKGYNPLGHDLDDQITLPISTVQRKLAGREVIAMILANAKSAADVGPAKEGIVRALRQQRRLRPGDPNSFDVSSVRELSQLAVVVTNSLQVLVAVIASISLVVGGVGIMNIMLVSVTERTREIGIRLAVGATPAAILGQFLIEAVVLTVAGGLLGVVLGAAGAVGLAYLAGWPVVVAPGTILLAFVITAAIGIFFGFYPALKASRLDPIKALHFE
jgi:putative ABC transport system permease protein